MADVARLPFKGDVFGGVVSLHTLHHLPLDEQRKAYNEIYRVLEPKKSAVLVNGWTESALMKRWHWLERLMERAGNLILKIKNPKKEAVVPVKKNKTEAGSTKGKKPTGTYVEKLTADWLRKELAGKDLKYSSGEV